ncbi:MAG: hypothetical protein FJ284_12745, partial [Planctomycetes bacterium]|nr:hypothetical protein [Planctomycetota bacterium]
MSRFRRWKSLNAWTSSRPARRWGRRHFVQQALFDMAVESLEPRVLMTHHVGSLDNSYTYPYTAPVMADLLEIDVTTEGWGRITAKQGASTLQTDTFTQFKAVEIDASGGAVNDTVKLLGSLAKVATNGLQSLTIKTGEGNDTVDFSALARPDQFVKVTIDAGTGADTFKAPQGNNTFDVTGFGIVGGIYEYTGTATAVDLRQQNYSTGPWRLSSATTSDFTTEQQGSTSVSAGPTTTVRLADAYSSGGTSGAVYEYLGTAATVNLGNQNYSVTTSWKKIFDPVSLTTASGMRALSPAASGTSGTRVRLADNYAKGGQPGAVYEYVGVAATVDLGGEDYGNITRWEQKLAPVTFTTASGQQSVTRAATKVQVLGSYQGDPGAGAVDSIAFSGVESVEAGTGDDQFFIAAGAKMTIAGGGGTDTIFGPDIAAGVIWSISGANAGDATAVGATSP